MGRGTVVAPLTSRGRPALCGPLARCPELLGATEAGRISATPSHHHHLDTHHHHHRFFAPLPAKGCEGIEGFFCNRCLYGDGLAHEFIAGEMGKCLRCLRRLRMELGSAWRASTRHRRCRHCPQGNEGQTMVLRMMVGDGVRPEMRAGSGPRIFRAGGGHQALRS